MLILIIIALCASTSFYRKAKQVGIYPGRLTVFPLVAAVVVLLLGNAGAFLLTYLFDAFGISLGVQKTIAFALDLFLLVAYLILLKHNWDALSKISNAVSQDISAEAE